MNKVVLVGRLTKDPELRFTANKGTAVTRFTLAVNRNFKKEDGTQEADFINCIAYSKRAEVIAQYLTKGKRFSVAGSIRTGSYDAQDGTRRYTTYVVVDGFDFIDSSDSKVNNDNFNDDMIPVDDGDIPF
ncbi:TPA: single-stranded DNA-binding protein [Clostridium perfringens]|uniref:single-stranded DNA-binding protein n=1 Tax=Clostridium perfringens TaxID=1502 RepID=UPI001A1E3218|nr:single-stranded DNA-binding protein [Clostridium perfringens]WFB43590.1 single-stranded DNA-binding protein [Clostridium perfringens]WFD75157.1 single-stranded DNA-binding protein [Clostridium perfringens]HAT4185220.1 single-stranded DNA-binding protein [Clostridium perfringens]HAT4187794.1 single-stranded DNA-binding protein [Clostridium perfringens]HAT4194162.1 single-stranded DNA-binding protein [Clostridium perfringens]